MSWDDEDFEVPTNEPVLDNWDDEFAETNDDPVLESWDAEPVAKAKPAPKPAAKKKSKKTESEQVLLEIDTIDEKTRKELLKKMELDADLNNAADLFGGLGVADEHPRARAARLQAEISAAASKRLTRDTPFEEHPLFQPAVDSKKEYEALRKALTPAITRLADESLMNYSNGLAIDMIRDVAKPLTIENIRKVVATLNLVIKDKEKAERQARLARAKQSSTGKTKAKNAARPNLGGAFKKDQEFDLSGKQEFEDFGDDDFM